MSRRRRVGQAMEKGDVVETNEMRAAFEAHGQVNAAGTFEVLAITEGTGNGWKFSAAALQEVSQAVGWG